MGKLNGVAAFTPKATQNTTTNQNGESIGVVTSNSGLNVRRGAGTIFILEIMVEFVSAEYRKHL